VSALKSTRSRHALPAFVRLLEDERSDLRSLAIEGLGQVGDPVVVPDLIERLRHDTYGLRVQAAHALGDIGGSDAIRALIAFGMEDRRSFVRCTSARSLGALQARAAIPRLVNALSEPGAVRSYAAVALIRIRDERAVEPLRLYWSSIGAGRRWAIRFELFGHELPLPDYLEQGR
jgi:HEAT repeat protein